MTCAEPNHVSTPGLLKNNDNPGFSTGMLAAAKVTLNAL
jgi:hypothetical protein